MKDCNNCYWKDYHGQWYIYTKCQPKEKICNKHSSICQKCNGEQSGYIYRGRHYCFDCLLKEFEVEENNITEYFLNGEYIGSNEDCDRVVKNISDNIEVLE